MSDKFAIRKGQPIFQPRSGQRTQKYPFAQMTEGDEFTVGNSPADAKNASSARTAFYKRYGKAKKFSITNRGNNIFVCQCVEDIKE